MTSMRMLSTSFRLMRQLRMLSFSASVNCSQSGNLGIGSGMAATSGAVRNSGGAFGQREQEFEELYFRKLSDEQLLALHDHHMEEIRFLEHEVKEHLEKIERRQQKIIQLKKIAEKM